MQVKQFICGLGILCCVFLNGCGNTVTPGNYDSSEVGKINKVVPGIIISMRPVNINSQMDTNSSSSVVNNQNALSADNTNTMVENINTGVVPNKGFQYIIKLSSGAIISVVQAEDSKLKIKQHILVIYGSTTHVVADDAVDET